MQAHGHVVALANADLPLHELGMELSAALHGFIPHEGYCLIGFDPISGLRVFQTSRDALTTDAPRLVHNETVEHDLHRYTDLARRPDPVGTLGGGGSGEAQSPRLHEILHPQGFSGELRLALRSGGTLWGALVLIREHRRPPFSDDEIVAAIAIAQPLIRAVKRISVRPHGQPPPPLPPGVVVVGPDGTAEAISPQAAAWFSDLHISGGLTTEDPLPYSVRVAAAAARAADIASADQIARIRTKSGRWLSLAACLLGSRRVAIVLQPATTDQLLPAIAAWHDLTPRQRDVLHLLLQGHPVKQIARRLGLSPHTIEDYLKALYRKTGTNSHQELIATLR